MTNKRLATTEYKAILQMGGVNLIGREQVIHVTGPHISLAVGKARHRLRLAAAPVHLWRGAARRVHSACRLVLFGGVLKKIGVKKIGDMSYAEDTATSSTS